MEKRRRTSKVDMANLRTRVWYQILESLEDYERELCSTEVFNFAFGVWRDAAKKCNLQFRKGHIYTGNNRMEFPYIYLPENLVFLPNDTGGVAALAYEGYWIRADYLGRKDGYRLHRVCRQKGTVLPDEIFENLEEHMQFVRSMEEKNEVARSKTRCITKRHLSC